jgi:hypothetical protein
MGARSTAAGDAAVIPLSGSKTNAIKAKNAVRSAAKRVGFHTVQISTARLKRHTTGLIGA